MTFWLTRRYNSLLITCSDKFVNVFLTSSYEKVDRPLIDRSYIQLLIVIAEIFCKNNHFLIMYAIFFAEFWKFRVFLFPTSTFFPTFVPITTKPHHHVNNHHIDIEQIAIWSYSWCSFFHNNPFGDTLSRISFQNASFGVENLLDSVGVETRASSKKYLPRFFRVITKTTT